MFEYHDIMTAAIWRQFYLVYAHNTHMTVPLCMYMDKCFYECLQEVKLRVMDS